VALWDTKTGKLVQEFGKADGFGWDVLAFSPDGKTVATPGGHRVEGRTSVQPDVVLWETGTGQERVHLALNEGQVALLAFSPDGRLLAAAGRTETIRLWDTLTGKEVGRFTGHRGWMNSLAFAPDGKTLASGGADSTVLIWDVSRLLPAAREPTEKLSQAELARCWDDLADTNAARAYQAVAALARRPDRAEGLLNDKLANGHAVSAVRLARLIADLDDDDVTAREKASAELANLGRLAEAALVKALKETSSAEVKSRAQALLDGLEGHVESPERRRLLRAVEVLERLGTPEARRLLGKLEKGPTAAEVAREAKASLERLGKAR
jgi:hypothetical protein